MTAPQRFYTPYEVAVHNSPDDCWVSFLGDVFDLTNLIKGKQGVTVEPILRAAGTDISHWFDAETGDVKTQVDPVTNLVRPYCPQGRFLQKGKLSARCRMVRVKNVLTKQEDLMEVPSEETVADIRARYLALNSHAMAYIWKAFKQDANGSFELFELDMKQTLEENGIQDETSIFEDHMIETDFYIPALHLYWSDDLTVA